MGGKLGLKPASGIKHSYFKSFINKNDSIKSNFTMFISVL